MGNYTQEDGLFKIDTPLGKDVLLLRGFQGSEAISRLFRFQLDLLSENKAISFSDIIGKNVTLSLKQPDGSYRYLNGIISRFKQQATEETFTAYTAEMVPWLWLLTRNADCRIFKNKTIPEIIIQVFTDLGFNDFTNSLQSSYVTREYCVQYRESDFNFVSRLMEQYGIFYFFKHQEGMHTLVLADSPSAHTSCPGQSSARYVTYSGGPQKDVITGWEIEQELRAGKYSHTDYNFETPSTSLMASEPTIYEVGGNSKFEIYHYFGEHLTKSVGQSLAKIRMQEVEAGHLVAQGSSLCRMFVSGYKFTLEEHPRQDLNTDYLLTEIHHAGTTDAFSASGSRQAEGEFYSNTFTCIPLSVPFRPLRVTARPKINSLQSAKVIGPSGDEISTDQYGRVQVMFDWDRQGTGTAWARVSQVWAGKNWGAMFLPRIGQEVLIDFWEGNPDYPIVVGRVYNAEQMPPGSLPANQNVSGFRSRSTKGGGEHDSNVLAFDDTMGSEIFYMRAQKDMVTRVEHDDIKSVDNDQRINIHNNRNEFVEVGDDTIVIEQGNRFVQVDVGNDSLSVEKGSHTTEAMQSITLKVGQSSIVLNQCGVTIKGMVIQIQATGMLVLQGKLTTIN